jgi:hypothetical protein
MIDIVERLIMYRDRPGRSREGRELLAEACNEIQRLRKYEPRKSGDVSVECPHCHWGFHPNVIAQHIREKH